MKKIVGLGKTLYNSNVATVSVDEEELDIELIINERITRKKYCGSWPLASLKKLELSNKEDIESIVDNSDVLTPYNKEIMSNKVYPFEDMTLKENISQFSNLTNRSIKMLPHHWAHAYSVMAQNPFEESLIIVMDGSGNKLIDIPANFIDKHYDVEKENLEHTSVFKQTGVKIDLVHKEFQNFQHYNNEQYKYAKGHGALFERASQLIFNNNMSAGKTMGLAAFGSPDSELDPIEIQKRLEWDKRNTGLSKEEWIESKNQQYWRNLAATVQKSFEENLINLATRLKKKYPQIQNLILTGGCALNCTANYKLKVASLFKNIYVSPYPGDESIGLGCAIFSALKTNSKVWSVKDINGQNSFLGSKKSVPTKLEVLEKFKDYNIFDKNITLKAAQDLQKNKIIACFQGRSEAGPRALGHRSILARVDSPNLKNYLNRNIKFREDFRPYGATIIQESSHMYFEHEPSFHNPFMSFAVPVKPFYKSLLKEVTHIDGTCRMQTLTSGQDPFYYRLIKDFEKVNGHPILLNTSLNIMGEPIVENIDDLYNFWINSKVDRMIVGNLYVTK